MEHSLQEAAMPDRQGSHQLLDRDPRAVTGLSGRSESKMRVEFPPAAFVGQLATRATTVEVGELTGIVYALPVQARQRLFAPQRER